MTVHWMHKEELVDHENQYASAWLGVGDDGSAWMLTTVHEEPDEINEEWLVAMSLVRTAPDEQPRTAQWTYTRAVYRNYIDAYETSMDLGERILNYGHAEAALALQEGA